MAHTAAPSRRPATYEDLLEVPDHLVAEILDGELIASPRPASPHAYTSSAIGADIHGAFHGAGGGGRHGGWWIIDEPELHLGSDILVPDLAGWRHERMPVFPNVAFFELAPDWACEVASPSTVRIDRVLKMTIYAREQVRHLWLVDPLARTLEVYRLENGRWMVVANHGGDQQVKAEPFEILEVDLTRWWPPMPT
jgi:Uma2 family endonuclease